MDNSHLTEIEAEFSKPQSQWEKADWRNVALRLSASLTEMTEVAESFAKTCKQHQENSTRYEEIIERLDSSLTKHKAFLERATEMIVELKSRRVGRPKKPNPAHTNALLALLHYKPKRQRGRPTKISLAESIAFVENIDRIKAEHGFKTDKEAVAEYCRPVPAYRRTNFIEYHRKLLSRLRKSVTNTQE